MYTWTISWECCKKINIQKDVHCVSLNYENITSNFYFHIWQSLADFNDISLNMHVCVLFKDYYNSFLISPILINPFHISFEICTWIISSECFKKIIFDTICSSCFYKIYQLSTTSLNKPMHKFKMTLSVHRGRASFDRQKLTMTLSVHVSRATFNRQELKMIFPIHVKMTVCSCRQGLL
jgi:hypothetical protein